MASSVFGSKVIHGDNQNFLLNVNALGKSSSSRLSKLKSDKINFLGYPSHIIQETGITEGIVVELGCTSTINCFKMFLYGGSYTYVVEVSKDNILWERVVDYSKSWCHDVQQLYFPAREVRFIRLLGISSNHYEVRTIQI